MRNMKDREKILKVKELIIKLIDDNYKEVHDYTNEFLDEVEDDTHYLYNVQHCRSLRNQYFDILNILEDES